MSLELAWYVGAPLAAAALAFGAIRVRRTRASSAIASVMEDDDAPLLLASVVSTELPGARDAEHAAQADADEEERGAASAVPDSKDAAAPARFGGAAARLVRGVVGRIVRRRDGEAEALDAPRPDVLTALHAEESALAAARPRPRPAPEPGAVVDAMPEPVADDEVRPRELRDNVTQLFPHVDQSIGGNGIVELVEPLDETDEEHPVGGPEWAETVATREVTLAATLAAREAALEQGRQREAEAEAARNQQELERIAVAEEARVRAEARARRWFVRLDPDLDAPTIAQRMTLAGTLEIRAPWAGKLLREAFAQEEEPKVRARIIGALVTGDHLDVAEPFETAFARGGIERGAVWEALKPRREGAEWIASLLAPIAEPMAAA
jgi:hypothetical protein